MAAMRRVVLRLLSFVRSNRAEDDLAREIHAHLQLLEDEFLARGLSPDEARLAARRAFGGVEQAKEHHRSVRSFRWMDGSWLDIKLAFRMLVEYPGLTLVGGLAMAFAIAVGSASFEFLTQLLRPSIPLEDGARLVGIRQWDAAASRVEELAPHDFLAWREDLTTMESVGAFRTLERNLITSDGLSEPLELVEISASAFRLARVPPLLGRTLVETDELAGARTVVVIGYDVWQARFAGDSGVVGLTVRLGKSASTIVGVMPKGFAFPVAHSLWAPLRLHAPDSQGSRGASIRVFGRLAAGVTLEEAQAELIGIGLRAAAESPETHGHLRLQVLPYARSIFDVSEASFGAASTNVFLLMLLVLVCGNVALLLFARAATRERELVVRSALGATRGRIVMQLFAEALVLAGVAAVVGLAAAGFALKWWLRVSQAEAGGRLPFWFDDSLAPATVLYAGALTVLAAVVAGVVPALKVTSRRVEARLRQTVPGGRGVRFGGLWTGLIVSQVAVTVAFPATAFFVRQHVTRVRSLDVGFPAEQYLSARLEMDRESTGAADPPPAEFPTRVQAAYEELERQLVAEPGVAGVSFADCLPRTLHARRRIEVDAGGGEPSETAMPRLVGRASVGVRFFDVLGSPVLSGRGFHPGDLDSSQRVVIVNESFVRRVLEGRNAIGRRVRYQQGSPAAEPGPWYEIVGVVRDLGIIADDPREGAGLYHPVPPDGAVPIQVAIHVAGDPASFAPRLRAIATAVDPAIRLHEVLPLDEVGSTLWLEFAFLFPLLIVVCAIALLLSLTGIYSVMSYTVSRRTREIGIRVALGASPRHVVAAISSRALVQVTLGVIAGGGLVLALTRVVAGLSAREAGLVIAYMALMMGVCLLACVVPTRRALRVEPTDALRSDG